MTHRTNKPTPKLRKAPQPPLSHAGAIPDSDRAKRPPLSEPAATGQELNSAQLSKLMKMTRSSSGMMTVV
jgi:hypothetical protein